MKLACCLLVLAGLAAVLVAGCDETFIGLQTKYSRGYSERKFHLVGPGMAEAQVTSLLGPPVNQTTQQWSEVWFYWPHDSQPKALKNQDGSYAFNSFGPVTYVRFSEAGRVVATSGDYLPLTNDLRGLTREQTLQKLGTPGQREVRRSEIIFHYSRSVGSGSYRRREVRFDTNGCVTCIVAESYYD